MVRDVGGEFDAIAGPVKSETRLPLPITLCRCQLLECLAEEKKVADSVKTPYLERFSQFPEVEILYFSRLQNRKKYSSFT